VRQKSARISKIFLAMKLVTPKCPAIIRWELHNQCNLSCPHCRHHALDKRKSDNYPDYYRTKKEFTTHEIDRLVEEVAEYKPSFTLNVANEPTIGDTFMHACRKIKAHGLSGTFNSNGLKLTKEIAKFLVEIEWDSVTISVDATTPESLMKARGIPFLDQVHDAVFNLLEARGDKPFPRIGVTFVDCDYNHDEIPEFLDFWKQHVDFIRTTGFIQDLIPDVEKIGGEIARSSVPEERLPCKQLFSDIVIRANGDVTRCVITSESPSLEDTVIGNVFSDGGVLGVWNSQEFERLRDIHNSGGACNLDYCNSCDYWIETLDMQEEVTEEFVIRKPGPYTTFYNIKNRIGNWDKERLHDRQGLIVSCLVE